MWCVSTDNDFEPEESTAYQAIMHKILSNLIASGEESLRWDLRGGAFGDADASTIAKGLGGNTSVTKLDLRDNRFTEAGLQEIAKMMEHNSTITSVDLGGAYPFRLASHTHIRTHTHALTYTHTHALTYTEKECADIQLMSY